MKLKILKIRKNKLYLENEIIDINRDIEIDFNLKENMDISNIYNDIILASIENKAMYLIYLKERTEFELEMKLKEKYLNKNLVNIKKVILKLKQNSYINDFEYAVNYIIVNKFKTEAKIKKSLIQKGISLKNISLAFETLSEDLDFEEIERNEIEKYISLNGNLSKEKIFSRLLNRGYKYSLIREVLKTKD